MFSPNVLSSPFLKLLFLHQNLLSCTLDPSVNFIKRLVQRLHIAAIHHPFRL
ncbi:hypothetical protein HanXRQr2_Chr01g0017111 [Helianthus annuus]|uniref:Uncharacterized protein n=1 Tax=Helianthus annuus TaxID=4232 RepID=A0A9K3JUJ6_HELAN|nr:hypothetical protein HanXRQr2_Chr01g0017111 [Helianthus annuus]KAJ0956582.1 hypothetical protein HanPSC8_Chr01g0016551 [Helianthus annuus]